MTPQQFDEFLKEWQDKERKVLLSKAEEYAEDAERFHNFNILSTLTGLPRLQVGSVLMLKNFLSFLDKVRKGEELSPEFLDEKLGDTRNYISLLRAMAYEDQTNDVMDLSYKSKLDD